MISVPATEERSSVRILEAGPAASVCPPNHCEFAYKWIISVFLNLFLFWG